MPSGGRRSRGTARWRHIFGVFVLNVFGWFLSSRIRFLWLRHSWPLQRVAHVRGTLLSERIGPPSELGDFAGNSLGELGEKATPTLSAYRPLDSTKGLVLLSYPCSETSVLSYGLRTTAAAAAAAGSKTTQRAVLSCRKQCKVFTSHEARLTCCGVVQGEGYIREGVRAPFDPE